MKKLTLITAIVTGGMFSCQDYLDDPAPGGSHDTPDGIHSLVRGAYKDLRFHHIGEWSYALNVYGTDLFRNTGRYGDPSENHGLFDEYTEALNPTESNILLPFWDNMYRQINQCNKGIAKIPEVFDQPENAAAGDKYMGELLFIRAFNYLELVEQFGGVPLQLEHVSGDDVIAPRAEVAENLRAIIHDLRRAESLLPDMIHSNKITKSAAQHFLAKAYLFRASERNAEITEVTDLDSAAYYAEQVINFSGRTLAPDFNDLFEYTAVNGPNESLSEIILASDFDDSDELSGNQTHMYFLNDYTKYPGMSLNLQDGLPKSRIRTTIYALENFRGSRDTRLYKSFQTAYIANEQSEEIPTWREENAPRPELVGTPKFDLGDTAVFMVPTRQDFYADAGASYQDYKDSFAPLVLFRWMNIDADIWQSDWNHDVFISLTKYRDPMRASPDDTEGTKDGILARLAETYLIAAEAYGRKGEYGKAVEYINVVRRRAAYKEGEDRYGFRYLIEPVREFDKRASGMSITEDVFNPKTTESNTQIYPTRSSYFVEDRFIHFILNERARELMGEFHRWVDLSRTATLEVRVHRFYRNSMRRNLVPEIHQLRPIPQSYLDELKVDGVPLTPEEKSAMQNPGY
ncbi:RagB/SusD family nutrient uptake outer membrane protein [Echinicola soli]|uniref:RagB/SusD family nutrient uptake outer membrane protein n=1 Tax=Echinicola soli TaxID=2591634 RepID=A0A514CGJ9_9BACT|nr:RagB/SusD family nutrient uptake outer membrane protein [Echinicola soli]QDH78947.1 RagB/SusD family nutrient uptake outer membrane protein [Echinicola soli]